MTPVAERLTADEYLARANPRRTELIEGVLVVNEPTVLHQRVVGLNYAALLAWTQAGSGRGVVSLPLEILLDEATVVAPDVLWFAEAIDIGAPRAPRMPDLAVEVRSPAHLGLRHRTQARPVRAPRAARNCGWPTPPAAPCFTRRCCQASPSPSASCCRLPNRATPNRRSRSIVATSGSQWSRSPTPRVIPHRAGSGAAPR